MQKWRQRIIEGKEGVGVQTVVADPTPTPSRKLSESLPSPGHVDVEIDTERRSLGPEWPTVVSFWYDCPESGTYYMDCAEDLRKACDRVGVMHRIERLDPTAIGGDKTGEEAWVSANKAKPAFIRRMIEDLRGPVIWLDVDSLLDRYPTLPVSDVAAVEYSAPCGKEKWVAQLGYEYVAGFIGFHYTPRAMAFLDRWIENTSASRNEHHSFIETLREMRGSLALASMPDSYCWRGGPSASASVARSFKRVRINEVKRGIEQAAFISATFGDDFRIMTDACKRSIRVNCPLAEHEVMELPEPEILHGNDGKPHWIDNNFHKFLYWLEALERREGQSVVLLDTDTLILRDPREAFQGRDFDVCFTDGVSDTQPINGGVIFVRVNERSLAFFRKWAEYDYRCYSDHAYGQRARRLHCGQNQASLNIMINVDKDTCGTKIGFLPAVTWNCVNERWLEFDPAQTKVLHIKGRLREYILHGKMVNCNFDFAPKLDEIAAAWNMYCAPGRQRGGVAK